MSLSNHTLNNPKQSNAIITISVFCSRMINTKYSKMKNKCFHHQDNVEGHMKKEINQYLCKAGFEINIALKHGSHHERDLSTFTLDRNTLLFAQTPEIVIFSQYQVLPEGH